ncbi:hypothetical protein BSKO_09201 [Bryopsis sp. KO-2023]|nr:hypothetical protein BSKO_09201 [Bryopsis sp. KO-2023]
MFAFGRNLLRLIFALSFATAISGAESGNRVLAILEDEALKVSHKEFLSSVVEAGFEVTTGLSRDGSLRLKEWDEWLFDHLIILAPRAIEFSRAFGVKDVLEFVDSGRNVLFTGDVGFSSKIGELAQECGVDLDGEDTQVLDHLNFAQGSGDAGLPDDDSALIAADTSPTDAITGGFDSGAPVLFRGVAATLPPDTELAVPALLAPSTSYSSGQKEKLSSVKDPAIGRDISLVTLVQARNNARVSIFGSLEMLSDAFFNAKFKVWASGVSHDAPANREFCFKTAMWTFQRRGVLVVEDDRIKHWEMSSKATPEMYRINDDIHFEIGVSEQRDGKKIPFKADDVQLEYTMMDPHIRTNLLPSKEGGVLSADFKAPDVYGVFKFVMEYRKPGYSYIDIVRQAPIRPFRHNEFGRFLVSAYPYYVSCFSIMIGFFVLGFFFLYHK